MSEQTLRIIVEHQGIAPQITSGEFPIDNPAEQIFRNMSLLRNASPFALSMIKRELKKFSCKSCKWEKE
jgi:hypothetical protein